ncbi:MAG TPA: NAD(P)-binding protein [Terracidiphilus sp.]|nr:NAD(P)-binding protein [Terracidiphilus sp.]
MDKRYEKFLLIGFAIVALGLGFWGYAIAGSDYTGGACLHQAAQIPPVPCPNPVRPFTWLEGLHCLIAAVGLLRLYDLFQPGIDPWQLVIAQIMVPGIALFSAGQLFLTSVRKNLRTAMARRKSNHSIVCGIGDVGMQIVQNLRAAHHLVVAIDLEGDSPNAATCEKAGVPVLQGDAKSPHVLIAAGIRRAQTAVVCTGSDSENMDIALQINAIHSQPPLRKNGAIKVLAELRNDWMHKRLIASDKRSLGSAHVDLRLFNSFNSAARMLIKRLRLPPSPEFEARTFVLVGFGAYGREIALQLIRSSPVALGERLKIVVFDQEADAAKEKFLITNPSAAEMATIEFVTAKVAPGSVDLARVVEPALESAGPLLGVALALGDDETSLCAALEMRSLLDRKGFVHVPVYVRLEHYRRLGEVVRTIEDISAFADRLQIFGTLEETLSADVLIGFRLDAFAQALHEDYRQRSQAAINPQANVPWHDLPEFMKMSNRWRADHTPLLMELAGLHLEPNVAAPPVLALSKDQIELLARLERRRYCIERGLIERRFGSAQRQSMPEWDELTEEQKESERNEAARLPEIMATLGIRLHAVHTVRLYGEWLAKAAAELEQLLAERTSFHCNLIVDLDDAGAAQAAVRGLSLPSFSLWLFSKDEPPEFWLRKPQGQPPDRARLIQRANGWSLRSRILAPQ